MATKPREINGKFPGSTGKYCPLNHNGGVCSSSCAWYVDNQYPPCGATRQNVTVEAKQDAPVVNIDVTSLRESIDELALYVMQIADTPSKPAITSEHKHTCKVENAAKVKQAASVDEWLRKYVSPFDIVNKTTKDVHEMFMTWVRMNDYEFTRTQRKFTESVCAITGLELDQKTTSWNSRVYKRTLEFDKWAAEKMAKEAS